MSTIRKYWVVLCILAVLALSCVVAYVRAAQGGAVTDSPKLRSFHAIPLYDGEELVSLTVIFTYSVPMLMPDGQRMRHHLRTEKADFVINGGQLVMIGDQLVEFGDLAEDILAVADFVWRLNNPNPLPTNPPQAVERRKKVPAGKRKALREP